MAALVITRSRALVRLSVLLLVVAACGGGADQPTETTTAESTETTAASDTTPEASAATTFEGPLLVGLAAPFTGDKGFLGPNLQKGVDVAIAGINAAGGTAGIQVELATADTEGNTQGAIAAVQKLITTDEVTAMIGPTSVTIMGVLERIQAAGVPTMIIAGTAALDATIKGETTFRATASDSIVGPAMAQAARDQESSSCAIVAESLEGAQSIKETIRPAFEALGGEINREIDIAVAQPSYRSELLQLVEQPVPDCVFFEISPETASQFWQNASEFPEVAEMLWIGNDVVLNEDSISAIQPVVDQLNLIAISPASIGPGRDDYVSAYAEIFPEDGEPVILADLGYDAMNILALAVHAANSLDYGAIAGQVQAVSAGGEQCTTFAACKEILDGGGDVDYEGASGSVNIDETGNSSSGFGIFEIDGTTVTQTGVLTEASVAELLDKLRG